MAMPETFTSIDLVVENGIARLTLKRPEVLNALTRAMIAELLQALAQIRDDPEARVLVLTGAGRGFCAGMDLGDPLTGLGTSREERSAVTREVMEKETNALIRALYTLPKPKVIAVNGVAAGGGVGIALAGDIVIASHSASFVQVFTPKLGLIPDCGCTWMLPRLVGRARAMALTMLGERLPAATAAEWGLIWKAVPDGELTGAVETVARHLANGPRAALALVTEALDRSGRHTLDEQLDFERDTNALLNASADFEEGVRAFMEKRAPRFV
ncbi:putative ring 1,2-epoxyphenylacetyl-CoA isomerase (oxepin-CoA forming) [Hyphomicrobiales bacterium]|nr:putative ring 1,2-epoxyphenylacetyl-CoA isomerase (oxepin-CoA forming) [Hyphomicrobiales bacterium]